VTINGVAAHFDGQAIVLDESIELPVGRPLKLHIEVDETSSIIADQLTQEQIAAKLKSMDKLFEVLSKLPPLPPDTFDRENLYDDMGRLA